jgi:predicted amidohydrolase YtcJ
MWRLNPGFGDQALRSALDELRSAQIRMYTLGSAYAAFEEDQKGSISPGKHADLVVLDADPCAVEPEAIREIRVLLTLVDGRPVFEA